MPDSFSASSSSSSRRIGQNSNRGIAVVADVATQHVPPGNMGHNWWLLIAHGCILVDRSTCIRMGLARILCVCRGLWLCGVILMDPRVVAATVLHPIVFIMQLGQKYEI